MKKEAQDVLAEMYVRDGALHPAKVLEEATDKTSPLHDMFDWDDTEAARKHRLNQARSIIRVAVRVLPAISNREVREYVSISSLRKTDTGSYIGVVDVLNDEVLREQALADAIKTLQNMASRYAYLAELASVWDAVAMLVAKTEAA